MPFPFEPFSFGWITPRLAVGSNPNNADDVATMLAAGITDYIDVRAESDATNLLAGTGIQYHHSARMIDDGRRQPVSDFVQIVTDARAILANTGTKILVACHAGTSRGPASAYSILRAAGLSPTDAWGRVKLARPQADRQYVPSAERAVPSFPNAAPMDLVGTPAASNTLAKVALLGAGVGAIVYGVRANPSVDLIPWWG